MSEQSCSIHGQSGGGDGEVESFNGRTGAVVPIASDYEGFFFAGPLTEGSVLFADAAGLIEEDNANFFYGDTANQLIVGPRGTGVFTGPAIVGVSTLTTSPRGIMSAQFDAGTNGARFHMRKARGTPSAPAIVVTGDTLGRLVASGYDGANFLEMGAIAIDAEGPIAATRVPTRITFSTATDAAPSVLTEVMRITSGREVRVGDGTTTVLTIDASGRIGVRISPGSANLVDLGNAVNHPGTGTTVRGFISNFIAPSTATTAVEAMSSRIRTAAAAFTVASAQAFIADTPGLGAGSAVTTLDAFLARNQGASGITNAYGVRVLAQSGAATLNVGGRFDSSTTCALWIDGAANGTAPNDGIMFGSSRDTNLYRGAANQLKTDDVFNINNAGGLLVSGTKVVGAQGASIADASGGAFIDAEARTALNALLARLRTHGLIAT